MLSGLKNLFSRRELFRTGGALALWQTKSAAAPAAAAATAGLQIGKDIYQSIGVRPLVNARGTFTIISGSLMLPEVRNAVQAAAQSFVHIDELMDAVGARLATLTGAEWGLVSSGCSAALTHATAACIAGGNPDLHVRIPNLTGFAKDEVIIPTHSRNVYDAAIRATGAKVIEVSTPEEMELAFSSKTAMVYILAGPNAEQGALAFPTVAELSKKHNVPVLVDAAAEILTVPNFHLQRGATLVAYSGGKCLRGPQTAGLLLGRKDLVQAAWVHSAPHHGYARALKIGKEEAIGMLMAVEMWLKRDHKAEWQRWMTWMNNIQQKLQGIDGLQMKINEPTELSNKTPSLQIRLDPKLGSSADVVKELMDGEPRITVAGGQGGINIVAYMMSPGDDQIVADRLHQILSKRKAAAAPEVKAPAGTVAGKWEVAVKYASSSSTHTLHLFQEGNKLTGTHQGDFLSRPVRGTINGDEVTIMSSISERHGDSLMYRFTGKLSGDSIAGALDMGEYRSASWSAKKAG